MDVGHQRIREMAYYLWEQEGRPESQAERHWAAAVAIVEAEDAAHEVSDSGEMTEDSGDDQVQQADRLRPLQEGHRRHALLHLRMRAKAGDQRPSAARASRLFRRPRLVTAPSSPTSTRHSTPSLAGLLSPGGVIS